MENAAFVLPWKLLACCTGWFLRSKGYYTGTLTQASAGAWDFNIAPGATGVKEANSKNQGTEQGLLQDHEKEMYVE